MNLFLSTTCKYELCKKTLLNHSHDPLIIVPQKNYVVLNNRAITFLFNYGSIFQKNTLK